MWLITITREDLTLETQTLSRQAALDFLADVMANHDLVGLPIAAVIDITLEPVLA